MKTPRGIFAVLLLAACNYQPPPPVFALEPSPVPRDTVLPYTDGHALCAAVVVGPRELLTARHCRRDMPNAVVVTATGAALPVLAAESYGDDGMRLRVSGGLPAPARLGRGRAVWFAGYGCRSSDDEWFRLIQTVDHSGTCYGNSGGGGFNAYGELVSIVWGRTHWN